MREIVLDTETTGLHPGEGDRIVELGCVELVNQVRTGRTYQQYVNPEREMPAKAFEIHGLDKTFLAGYPVFAEVVDDFLAFIAEAPLIIHNAAFDLGFINAELARLERPPLLTGRVIDTVEMARRKFPGGNASLDALCRRFGIDTSARSRHGAVLDAELLADVYLELTGGRQATLTFGAAAARATGAETGRVQRPPRPHAPSPEEKAAHDALLDTLSDPLWRQ